MKLPNIKTKGVTLLMSATFLLSACGGNNTQEKETASEEPQQEKWSVRLAESDMKRYKDWMTGEPYWGYHEGLIGKAMLDMREYTGDEKYFELIKQFGEDIIEEDGTIRTYDLDSYNIDNINSGKMLIPLYQETGKEKYKKALDTLMKQLENHPRVSDGGFWHKKRYPHQVWLDGLYMAGPFLTAYGTAFDKPEHLEDAIDQIIEVSNVHYDPEKQLFYHGWDESKEQDWANKKTGLSSNFWSRSIGWYAMAVVDVLDFVPQDHPDREKLIEIAGKLAEGIQRYQDEASGVWYQVTDQGDREGNYLESSGTAMFVYFLYKGVRKGYLDEAYLKTAHKGYEGLVEQFFKVEDNGMVTVTDACSVAGLGGDGNRDGSFEYYISEPIKENDPKANAPAIMASIEHERSVK